jgi:hypothetical protein
MFELKDSLTKIISLLLASYIIAQVLRFGRREKYLPPGPSTVPVLGNAHLLPATGLHTKYLFRSMFAPRHYD